MTLSLTTCTTVGMTEIGNDSQLKETMLTSNPFIHDRIITYYTCTFRSMYTCIHTLIILLLSDRNTAKEDEKDAGNTNTWH